MVVMPNGNIGFNTSSPVTGFDVRSNISNVLWSDGSSRNTSAYFRKDFDQNVPSALSGIVGVDNAFTPTANSALNVNGALFLLSLNGTSTFNPLISNAFLATGVHNGSGPVTTLAGGRSRYQYGANATGPVTNGFGMRGELVLSGVGTTTNAYAFETDVSSGNVAGRGQNVGGYHFAVPAKGAAYTYGTVFGFKAEDFNLGSTTIGFWQTGTSAHNRFNGNTMFGADNTPSSTVHASGTVIAGVGLNSPGCFAQYIAGSSTLFYVGISTSTNVTGLGLQTFATTTKPSGCQ
jgi:hypothetical protein